MKIPFDIKYRPQIESGEYKVITRCGQPVRIICWDANSDSPIVYLVTEHDDLDNRDKEYGYTCNNYGRAFPTKASRDIFIITPEPELTSWQKFISGCLQKHGLLDCGHADRIAKERSAELLKLAKKELVPLFGTEYVSGYEDGFDDGKAEALKDLPRWEKYPHNAGEEPLVNGILQEDGSYKWRLYLNGYKIEISDLEKLPGFKED